MLKEANNIIDNAISKAEKDKQNEKIDFYYSPEFVIELLTEIKQVMNTPIETKLDSTDIRNFHQMD